MEPEGSLPYSQVPATCPYPEPTPSSSHDPLQLPEHHGLATLLFNLIIEYVMRKVTVDRNTVLQNKLIPIVGYANDMNNG
jgi:hypothetical protein